MSRLLAAIEMDAKKSITHLIQNAGDDADGLAAQLFPFIYDELRRLAAQMMKKLPPKQTLQPTALVHEAFLRLGAINAPEWKSRQHFFRTAARAMRFILVDQARRKSSAKRGAVLSEGDVQQVSVEIGLPADELLALHEAMERLEKKNPRQAQLVDLKFFGGMSEPEVARILEISRPTVAREWRYARYWLYGQISGNVDAG